MAKGEKSPSVQGDGLSHLAPLLRVRPVLDTICRFGNGWSSPHTPERDGWVPFHLITQGRCRIDLPDGTSPEFSVGDIIVLPHGSAHVLRDVGQTKPIIKIKTYDTGAIPLKTNLPVTKTAGDVPADMDVELICGRLHFELAQQNLVVAALPSQIVLRAGESLQMGRLQQLLANIRDELTANEPGAAAIATDLASALMVMVLRLHLADAQIIKNGILALLAQKQVAKAVIAMIEAPARGWTLDQLAEVAGASRATLVRLFQKTAGAAPLEFLTDLRLNLARNKLAAGTQSLAEIADAIGYQSESAFSRAFSRHFGLPPSAARQTSSSA